MKSQNKELLIKDLCSRLPYEVKVRRYKYTTPTTAIESTELFGLGWLEELYTEEAEFKPYLFPMSSMTEEQKKTYYLLCNRVIVDAEFGNAYESIYCDNYQSLDYLLENHFDYRGLIEKGLAIDATGLNIY